MTEAKELAAGPELDLRIARDVYGWRQPTAKEWCDANDVWYDPNFDTSEYFVDDDGRVRHVQFFNPSRKIDAAWQVIERLHLDGLAVHVYRGATPDAPFMVQVGEAEQPMHQTFAPTAPLAICRAALQAAAVTRSAS